MENLVIVSKQIATIEWNKDKAIQEAKEIMAKYEGLEFKEEDLAVAKKEVATLRKVSKAINSQALAVDKELTAPVKLFRSEVKEVKAIVDSGIEFINEQVKQFELNIAQERTVEILEWEEWKSIEEYCLFNPDWLLKKWTDKALQIELADMLFKINNDIKVIDINADTLKLDSEKYVNQLKEDYDLTSILVRMKEDYELLNTKVEEPQIIEVIEINPNEELITITRTIKGTETQLIALKEYALKLGVEYK